MALVKQVTGRLFRWFNHRWACLHRIGHQAAFRGIRPAHVAIFTDGIYHIPFGIALDGPRQVGGERHHLVVVFDGIATHSRHGTPAQPLALARNDGHGRIGTERQRIPAVAAPHHSVDGELCSLIGSEQMLRRAPHGIFVFGDFVIPVGATAQVHGCAVSIHRVVFGINGRQ